MYADDLEANRAREYKRESSREISEIRRMGNFCDEIKRRSLTEAVRAQLWESQRHLVGALIENAILY